MIKQILKLLLPIFLPVWLYADFLNLNFSALHDVGKSMKALDNLTLFEMKKPCNCLLVETKNLRLNISNKDDIEHFTLNATLVSNKIYSQNFKCQPHIDGNFTKYVCRGKDNSGDLWIKYIHKKGYFVQFKKIRLDKIYRELGYTYVVSNESNSTQAKCIPCP